MRARVAGRDGERAGFGEQRVRLFPSARGLGARGGEESFGRERRELRGDRAHERVVARGLDAEQRQLLRDSREQPPARARGDDLRDEVEIAFGAPAYVVLREDVLARVRAETRAQVGVGDEASEVRAQERVGVFARLDLDDAVVGQFAEPADRSDDRADARRHDAAEATGSLADGALAQVERDVGLADAPLELFERDVAGDFDPVFKAALAHERAHVEVTVRVADERVAKVVCVAQAGECAQRALDALVGGDESERGYSDGIGGTRRLVRRRRGGLVVVDARGRGGGLGRDVVVDAADGDAGRDTFEARPAPVGVDDDAFGGAREAAVEREVERAREQGGRRAARERLLGLATRFVAVAGCDLVQVDAHVAAPAREPEEEVLKREVVKDDHARVRAQHVEDARVVAVVVPHLVDGRVELAEAVERAGVAAVVAHLEALGQRHVRRPEALDEQSHLGPRRREVRQKLLAVIRYPRTLRAEGAEVGELHKTGVSSQ